MAQNTELQPAALTINGAVRYTAASRSRIYELIKAREIEAIKVGRRTLVLRASVDAWLQRQRRAA
jgi:excisionase family DNA binding protein